MKRLLGFVFTVQRMVTCTYHLNTSVAIFIYEWRYQARHYCAYAYGLPYLFRLRALPFTSQTTSILCRLLGTNYRNVFRKSCASFDSFITYNPLKSYVFQISSKKDNETKSFIKKYYKKCYIKIYLYFNLLFAVLQLIYLVY